MVAFALNHMSAPRLGWQAFLDLAANLGCVGVEFRNDLPGPLYGGADPAEAAAGLRARGLRLLALAEVKMFNDWSEAKRAEAAALMAVAVASGAEAVSLIPRNDGVGTDREQSRRLAELALRELLPMLRGHGLKGMVEPLGFEVCSLRYKEDAMAAIAAVGGEDTLFLVHDTFHHHLAGDGPIFPDQTGIVHVSGVADSAVGVGEMRDGHRVLVDADDRLGNVAQLSALASAGYAGPVSFEPFAASVHALDDPTADLRSSMSFLTMELTAAAA